MEDNFPHLNVWIVNDVEMGCMIPRVLKPEDLEHTFGIIVLDLEQPWDLMNQCEKWMKVLKEAIFQLTPKLNLNQMESLRERIVDLYKTY